MKIVTLIIVTIGLLGFQSKDLTQDLKEARIKFDLVGRIWYLADKRKQEASTIYYYKRMPIEDKAKLRVIPGMSVVIEDLGKEMGASAYCDSRRKQSNITITEEYSNDSGKFDFENAVGFKGTYVDHFKNDHTVIVVYGVNGKKGFQFICDVVSEHIDKVEGEFLKTIKTIRKK